MRKSLAFAAVVLGILGLLVSSRQAPPGGTDRPEPSGEGEEKRAERIMSMHGTMRILGNLIVLRKALGDPSLRVKLAVVDKLAQAPTQETTELLVMALKDPNRSVAGRAYRALKDRGAKVDRPFTGVEFLGHENPIPAGILEDLKSSDETRRQVAVVALRKYATPVQAVELLGKALKDPFVKVRFLAVEEAARLPPVQALGLLKVARKDEDPRVREKAERALKALESSPAPAASPPASLKDRP